MSRILAGWTLQQMEDLYAELGSFRKCAKQVGTTHGTWIRYYEEKKQKQEDGSQSRLTKFISKPKIDEAIQTVQDSGYFVTKKPLQRGYSFDLEPEPVDTNIYKIGIVSDTHLGSRYQQLNSLWKFYEECDNQGIDTVLHAGDLSDGVQMYNGQQFEIFLHGERAQAQYIIDNYPKIDGINNYIIGGNHDESFYKKYGSDICYDVSIQRPDMLYKGFYLANFNIKGINICLHHGDGGVAYARCFDKETEILTKERGWIKFSELNRTENVATLNIEKDAFEWQKPTDYIDQEYDGELIHFKARKIDLLVTPNHRMLVKRSESRLPILQKPCSYPTKSHPSIQRGWQVMNASELLDNYKIQQWSMKITSNNWVGKDCGDFIDIPQITYSKYNKYGKNGNDPLNAIEKLNKIDALSLIAWYVTEGSLTDNAVCISQSTTANPENHKDICELLDRSGYRYFVSGKDVIVASKQLSNWLNSECGNGSKNKYLPTWVKELPSSDLRIVFDTMIKGDGWISGEKSFGYTSISKKLRTDFQEIALKLGYACKETKDSISVANVQVEPTLNIPPERVSYSDRVYCVSVPNTYILVRRNGKAIWSGNSYRPQKLALSKIEDKRTKTPEILAIGHYHTACVLPDYVGIYTIQMPCFQGMTPAFMGKKGMNPDIGGIILEFEEQDGKMISSKTQYISYKAKEDDY